ncbi:MAG: TolC family protein [Phycisphaerae bacterium]|jgi:outer membrane protein TolC
MIRRLMLARPGGIAGLLVLSALWTGGCVPPKLYRQDADRVAYDIVSKAQQSTLGRTEPFTIETPAETLRRRLMLDQELPHASSASLGAGDLEPIKQWPDADYLAKPETQPAYAEGWDTTAALTLTLVDALQVAAHESREFQARKEQVFETALALDLERDAFRFTWDGQARTLFDTQLEQTVTIDDEGNTDRQAVRGMEYGGTLGISKRLANGMSFTGAITLDLVSMLTQDRLFSRGIYADGSATLPLLRGAGEFIVGEPLTQAERDVAYAIYDFEQYKRDFAVDIASEYLSVLRQLDSVGIAEDNYRRLIASTRRARRLADAGELPEIQVDQSRQDELRARNQWISTRLAYERQLDSFKVRLGLSTDAHVVLDPSELRTAQDAVQKLLPVEEEAATAATAEPAAESPPADAEIVLVEPERKGGRYEIEESVAIQAALKHRGDLRVAVGRVQDAQRAVAIAADQLRTEITILGNASAGSGRSVGSAGQDDAILRPDEGHYSALLTIDLPLERTAERNAYRRSLIRLEQTVRDVQALEDQIKLDVRNGLSRLLEARETVKIQVDAVKVAERRVASAGLLLEAGRAEIRDLLEAQDALVTAKNSLTSAHVNYRVNELALQRDLGLLEVDERGLWREYVPEEGTD